MATIEGTLHLDLIPDKTVRLVLSPHTKGTNARPLGIKNTGVTIVRPRIVLGIHTVKGEECSRATGEGWTTPSLRHRGRTGGQQVVFLRANSGLGAIHDPWKVFEPTSFLNIVLACIAACI